MIRARSLSILGVLAIAACAEPTVQPSLVGGGPAVASIADGTDTYLVRFKGNGIPDDFAASVAALGGEVLWAHAGVGIGAVSGINDAGAASLAARGDVTAVDADAYTLLDDPAAMSVETSEGIASTENPAGASGFARQWNMKAIHAPEAWAAGKLGKSTTRVGILDTGIGYLNVDLAGLVDLPASQSFLSAADNKQVTDTFPGAHVVADLHYHGSHVAATVSSNAVQRAGVTSKVKLVGIKVCRPSGSCPTSAVLGGMLYAADIGLDVINMSLGGEFHPSGASARGGFGPSFFATMNAVFHYVYNKGTLVVVSAGNSSFDLQHGLAKTDTALASAYCDAPRVICVSATGPTAEATVNGPWTNIDALAGYSNFGKHHITVAAPGGNKASFVSATCSRFSIVLAVCRTGNFTVGLQGTSMAAPHVTGLAALIAGEVGHNPAAITARLIDSADDLGAQGNDAAYGFGRINVAKGMGL
jgi:lantibiotic leader peptide-processing serine protease